MVALEEHQGFVTDVERGRRRYVYFTTLIFLWSHVIHKQTPGLGMITKRQKGSPAARKTSRDSREHLALAPPTLAKVHIL